MTQSPPAEGAVRIEESLEALLAGAESRSAWKAADSKSGNRFERVMIGGVRHVVKYNCVDDDWLMRATGDAGCRLLGLVRSGVLGALPASIDHTMVACAPYDTEHGRRGVALLMRDVGGCVVPEGSALIPLEQQRRFLHDMASLHAAHWGYTDDGSLFPMAHHYVFLTPVMAELEAQRHGSDQVPSAVATGWRRMRDVYPREAAALGELAADPGPLVAALQRGPLTLLHGDWKLGNVGSHEDGRTILLDWDRCGSGSPLLELAWYLAVNCDRLPESKEDTIAVYRTALQAAGVPVDGWWDSVLEVALVGAFLQLGWSKLDDAREFGWWSERLDAGLRRL